MRNGSLLLASILLWGSTVRAEVPPPSATPAKIVVSGHTSTAVDIKMVKVGQEIPKTYAGQQIHNTPGFEFYVSQHYALKSNKGDGYATHMLEIAELAYPHWVALVGAAPPDPDTRMYFVCAGNGDQMIEAMKSDIGMGTAGGYGGGITIYTNHSAYNYPSGTLMYHQRALVIHENLHMLQMIVYGTGGSEGFTYSGEQHVYDPAKKQLTVLCFDKPTMNNHTDAGLAALGKQFIPMQKAVETLWGAGGGHGVLYTQFFLTDPDRWLKFCIWRDEYYRGRVGREPNARVMEDIFGPLDRLNARWEQWLSARRSSFHFVDWGWEQEGNALVAYGWPWDRKYWSQTDLNYAPSEKVEYDPLRMDYPAEPLPPIVGPVQRGVAEPSVGYVFNFSRSPGCWGGLGLGIQGRSMCQVVLAGGRLLVIDGKDFGIARKEVPLSEDVKEAAKADGLRYGVTIQIKPQELEITVRAGKPEAIKQLKTSVPLNQSQHERLTSKYMSIIGKDGYPCITPFIDDARRMPPDLTKPAAPNLWRFDGMEQLLTLYKAAWRLKDKTPRTLRALKTRMLEAVGKDPAAEAQALRAYEDRILQIVSDVRDCDADQQTKALALAELTGTLILFNGASQGDAPDRVTLTNTKLIARLKDPVQCELRFESPSRLAGSLPPPQRLTLPIYRPKTITAVCPWPARLEPTPVTATIELTWRGQQIAVPFAQTVANTSIPRWWIIGPFDNPGGPTVEVKHPIEAQPIDLAKKYPGQGGAATWRKGERPANMPVLSEFVVDLAEVLGPRANVAAYALVWVDSDKARDALLALGSDDGAVVWLNDKPLHKNLVPRAYGSQSDRIPIHLNQGRNKLLVKITQRGGPWCFGAHLLKPDGGFLSGVKYSLRPGAGSAKPEPAPGGENR